MLKLNHKRLEVWSLSLDFIKVIYSVTQSFPKNEMFGLTSQMKRAAVSVTSNLSEGSSRISRLERKRFFEISRSSLVEIDTQLEIAHRLGYLTEQNLNNLNEMINKLFAKLTNLILKT